MTNSRHKMVTAAALTALVASLAVNGLSMYRDRATSDVIQAFSLANHNLAWQLLLDGVENKRIDVFVWHDATAETIAAGEYTIRVLPLLNLHFKHVLRWSSAAFMNNNNGVVIHYASAIWDENRDVSRALLDVLAKKSQASEFLQEVRKDGSLTEKGRTMVRDAQCVLLFARQDKRDPWAVLNKAVAP